MPALWAWKIAGKRLATNMSHLWCCCRAKVEATTAPSNLIDDNPTGDLCKTSNNQQPTSKELRALSLDVRCWLLVVSFRPWKNLSACQETSARRRCATGRGASRRCAADGCARCC